MIKNTLIVAFITFIPQVLLAQSTENPFIQNKFNPDISLIVDMAFISSDIKDESRSHLEIPEFMDHPPHSHINKNRGLYLNYLELAFVAPVDPFFDFAAIMTLAPEHGIELEEVYADTKFLPSGFGLRLGKFKSAALRHNQKHAHNWDFYDSPLIYDALLGSEGLSDVGLRLTYTLPLDTFIQIGSEVYQGASDEAVSFNADGFVFGKEEIEPTAKPALFTGFLKGSFDFGNNVFLLGAAIMYGQSNLLHSHHHEDEEVEEPDQAINADGTIIYGFEATYKYIIDSYRYLSFEGEYISRIIDGDLLKMDENKDVSRFKLNKTNSGTYSQLLFKFDSQWRTGIRVDYLFPAKIKIDGSKEEKAADRLYKISYMIEYYFTEFSRFRLQYNYDHSRYFEERLLPIQEFIFSLNFAVGPHGAHAF
ncbi:MAG: hypothetical protein ACUVUQ_12080 [Thermodesulfovibrionales bacterium]